MIIKTVTTIVLLMSLFVGLDGQTLYRVSEGSVSFSSDAPLELIEAECYEMQGVLRMDDRTFAFRVPMTKFEGFNSALQRTHFNANYLETDKHPFTIFEGKIIEEVDFSKPGTYSVRGKGRFTCHGIEQERIIKCKLVITAKGIHVSSNYTVLLDDHDITIPSVVNQRIAEEITVVLEIDLKK